MDLYSIHFKKGKVKRSLFLFIAVMFFSCVLFSQERTSLPFKTAIKWAPFGLFDFFGGPNMKAGIDFRVQKKVVLGIDGGAVLFPYPYRRNSGGFARAEVKFFSVDENSFNSGTFGYAGAEVMYKYQQFSRSDSISIPGMQHYSEDYTMYRNVYALHLKAGALIYFLQKTKVMRDEHSMPSFFMEIFFGAGVRQVTGYCAGLTAKEADNREFENFNVTTFALKSGSYIRPSFVMSVKFGWRIK